MAAVGIQWIVRAGAARRLKYAYEEVENIETQNVRVKNADVVMVIDDSPLITKIVKSNLEGMYGIMTAKSGREAVEILQTQIPDLILLDVEMPGINGFETIRLLKENKRTQKIPVIFLTSKDDQNSEFEGLDLGAVDYITKPFSTDLLKKRIELHLALVNQQRALEDYNTNLAAMVDEKTEIILELQYAIVYALADLAERRDGTTGGHIRRMQYYLKELVEGLYRSGIYKDELSKLNANLFYESAQLHDIGKVAIPDAILLKPARLTADEFEIMKTHTVVGQQAVLNAMNYTKEKTFLQYAADITISHHERWDGEGYPYKLKGAQIPLTGRLTSITDVYDALISVRPYKQAWSHMDAVDMIIKGSGTCFDPLLVEVFEQVHRRFEKIAAHGYEDGM